MSARHDVIVVGAGPAGSAAAYYLAKQGIDVLLLDKADFPRDKTCGDGLTPRALAILQDIGLLDELLRVGRRANGIDLFAPSGRRTTVLVQNMDGLREYMLIVPRRILDDTIRAQAVAQGAAFQGRVEATGVEHEQGGILVHAEQGGRAMSFRARAAIVATGASLKLLRSMGLVRRNPPMMLAARAYFDGLSGLHERIECHFDGVPLPGYGWVFPLSASSANIGAGIMPAGHLSRKRTATGHQAFQRFLQTPSLRPMLETARQVGPIKGYPIRTDFDRSPTYAERVLLAGEAVGLTNPLTGEGIDYALESGRLAAEHSAAMLQHDDFAPSRLAAYDRELRQHFQHLFVMSNRLRGLYLNPLLLNRVVQAANRHADVKTMISNITVGNRGLDQGFSPNMLLKVALAM